MKRLLIALLMFSTPVNADDRSYAKDEDACLESLIDYPGSGTGLFTGGMVKGFYYTIHITRTPEYDEDDATLKREAESLRLKLKNIEEELAK